MKNKKGIEDGDLKWLGYLICIISSIISISVIYMILI